VPQSLIFLTGQTGVALVVLNILLDQIGIPIPALPTLIVAGAIAAHRGMPPLELFAGCVAASVLADVAWYAAGRRYGNRVMKILCRVSLTPDSCVSQTQLRFERWGAGALILAKFVPGLGLLAPPLAGAIRMTVARFLSFSALGSAMWAGLFLGLGALFQSQIAGLLPLVRQLGGVVFEVLGVMLAAYVIYKWWERRRFQAMLRMSRISVAELHRMMDEGSAPLIIDVRAPTAQLLEARRIPGALPLSLEEIARELPGLPRDREIVLYCSCPNEASAALAARTLRLNGFTKARPLRGGLDEWIREGLPVEVTQREKAAPARE